MDRLQSASGTVAAPTGRRPVSCADRGCGLAAATQREHHARQLHEVQQNWSQQKLRLDCTSAFGRVVAMDNDTRDLIRQLCTRAGMIMEDMSLPAIMAGAEDRLVELEAAAAKIVALLRAARALHG